MQKMQLISGQESFFIYSLKVGIDTYCPTTPILGQWGKDSEVWKKISSSQIQLIPSIAALVLSLPIDFYPDPFRVS